MNKSNIINSVIELNPKLPKDCVKRIVNNLFNSLAVALSSNKRIEIRGFGSFCLKLRKPGLVRNPKDKTMLQSGPRYKAYFRPGKELAKKVNDKFQLSTGNTQILGITQIKLEKTEAYPNLGFEKVAE